MLFIKIKIYFFAKKDNLFIYKENSSHKGYIMQNIYVQNWWDLKQSIWTTLNHTCNPPSSLMGQSVINLGHHNRWTLLIDSKACLIVSNTTHTLHGIEAIPNKTSTAILHSFSTCMIKLPWLLCRWQVILLLKAMHTQNCWIITPKPSLHSFKLVLP